MKRSRFNRKRQAFIADSIQLCEGAETHPFRAAMICPERYILVDPYEGVDSHRPLYVGLFPMAGR